MSLPPLDVPGLLRKYGLRPDKRLGQNFLVDEAALRRVVEAASLTPEESVLEIGPGVGSLTRHLARAARRVTAVELDGRLLPPLAEVLAGFTNVEVVEGDIMKLNVPRLMGASGYVVAANIPYYITSALIRLLLESGSQPSRMILTVQNEVAGRITAKPGDLSLLALSVQVYGAPRIAAHIPAGAFYPAPQVDSAVVRVDLLPEPIIPAPLLPAFFRLAKAGFSQKRKTLRNSLSAGLAWKPPEAENLLRSTGIDPGRRAETLSLAEWGRLAEAFARSTPQKQEQSRQAAQPGREDEQGP